MAETLVERLRRLGSNAPCCADGSICYEWDGGAAYDEAANTIEALEGAGRGIIDRMSDTLSNGNGVEADDGEKCWIVHSDDIEELRRALALTSTDKPGVGG